MNIFRTVLDEAIGLFVDDGMLALLCGVLIAVVAGAVLLLGLPSVWGGVLLLVGCIGILAWSVARAAA